MSHSSLPSEIFSGIWNGGHCQGIALDSEHKHIYYSFTTMLIKTDLQGRVIGSVTGLLGHLGCIDFCDRDGRVYGSLEYKSDAIGKGILKHAGSDAQLQDGFYIAIFDVDKIDRMNMDACSDGVMTSVFLNEVLEDYKAEVECGGEIFPHRHGCSGIDGTAFGRIPGDHSGREYLFVAYGVYGDVSRTDNDDQVILCYDTSDWAAYEKPLSQGKMHRCGPDRPEHKFFVHTGNTTYGVQNLEYDEATGNFLMAVYKGQKPEYPNYSLYVIDGSKAPVDERLSLLSNGTDEATPGWHFPHGSTGLYALGDGQFYISCHGRSEEGHYTHVRLYRWDGMTPLKEV